MKHCFIVTSAINSKFGVYKPDERLAQTLATVDSIRQRVPGAKVVLMECAGTPLTAEQESALDAAVDVFVDLTDDEDVKAIYQSDNWDVVKNTTEIMCFAQVLDMCYADGDLDGIDRVHKISGRYLLNDDFNTDVYEQYPDKIIIGPKHQSQFPFEVTGIELQYMARLWSWPIEITEEVIGVYQDSLAYISQRIQQGGYADIEHVLYKFLPAEKVQEIPLLGIEGTIAPNGVAIKN